jgi:hypothetical protein
MEEEDEEEEGGREGVIWLDSVRKGKAFWEGRALRMEEGCPMSIVFVEKESFSISSPPSSSHARSSSFKIVAQGQV